MIAEEWRREREAAYRRARGLALALVFAVVALALLGGFVVLVGVLLGVGPWVGLYVILALGGIGAAFVASAGGDRS